MQIYFCRKHPRVIANYKCYQCKSPICKECRFPRDHHYFCGINCYNKYRWQKFKTALVRHKFQLLLGGQILLFLLLLAQFAYFQNESHHPIPVIIQAASKEMPATPELADTLLNEITFIHSAEKVENQFRLQLDLPEKWLTVLIMDREKSLSKIAQKRGLQSWDLPLKRGQHQIELLLFNAKKELRLSKIYQVNHQIRDFSTLRRSLSKIDRGQPNIAFTFDGGSDSSETRNILRILRQCQVQCTVFLTGKFMEKFPGLVKSILQDGHEIGNHLYNHPHLTSYEENRRQQLLAGIDQNFITLQLQKTDSILFHNFGIHSMPYWRAPYGEYNQQILDWAASAGYRHIRWTRSFDSFDWVSDQSSRLYRTPQQFLTHFTNALKQKEATLNGTIVLMHLGSHRKTGHIYQILPQLFAKLRKHGYQIRKISEMLSRKTNA